jgi:predicted metal-dependent phosphoesterase TrpH
MKVLFHCHTDASPCSNVGVDRLIEFLNQNKYDAVAVTDHNLVTTIHWPEGLVIPADEIATTQGDIIGLFLSQKVKSGLSIEETSSRIRAQGGIVVAAHPCDILRHEAIGRKALLDNIEHLDVIEVFNSRNLLNSANRQAAEVAEEKSIPTIVGADAHTFGELGNAYLIMNKFTDASGFLNSLETAQVFTRPAGMLPHFKTYFIKKSVQRQKHLR